jgi:hypothetical protein
LSARARSRSASAQHAARLPEKILPGRGHAQAATDAIEKRYAQFRFQRVNLPGSRGLTQVQTDERPGKAAFLRNADEGSKLSKIH